MDNLISMPISSEKDNYYYDSLEMYFEDFQEFLKFLVERENNSLWKNEKNINIRLLSIEEAEKEILDKFNTKYKKDILEDTKRNTGLLLKVKDDYIPIRDCAIRTIFDRAKISGNSLLKVSKPILSKILNYCMEVTLGSSLIRISEEKISAVLGGGKGDYAVLEIPKLIEHTENYLKNNFKNCEFIGGSYEHSLVSALWELSASSDLIKTYKMNLLKNNLPSMDIKPALRLITSDVGISSVSLYPMLFMGIENKIIPLGNTLKLEHKNNATIKQFEQKLSMLFSQYQKAITNITSLMNIEIKNPINTMTNVMKHISIPKKIAFEAIELFKFQNGIGCCTAYDIYCGINEVIFLSQCLGINGFRLIDMEERVARALSVNWNDFDIPGEIKW